MAIEWLAGNRLRGTTAERPALGLPSGSVGGWVEVGRTTLGSTQTTIDVSSLDDKRYLMVLIDGQIAGSTNSAYILNNSTSGYATRKNYNGGTDNVSDVNFSLARTNGWGQALPEFNVMYMSNLVNKDKSIINHGVGQSTAGAGASPTRSEIVTKWTGTDVIDQITAVDYNNSGSGYASGSEVVVLGYDPDDTHTTNFWEELASVDITSGSQMTANFTAKKYLWIQFYYEVSTTSSELFFNNDQGNNYARRYSNDGGSDTTNTSIAGIQTNLGWDTNPHYGNMFVINNSANEKLVIGNMMTQLTAGAGTAPGRLEFVSKWANTSAQINRFDIKNTGSFSRGICKVWGSD